ncbi:hypothetical protein EDB84DRAFT_1570168 [Lactarius hengduanensis]|nr:hypothetical protein EDB84DRAFT_1570168 [Lactarius hengduanensis]
MAFNTRSDDYSNRGDLREIRGSAATRVKEHRTWYRGSSNSNGATCAQTFAARLEVDNRFENSTHKEVPKCKWSSDSATCARTPAAHSYLGDSIYGTRGDVYSIEAQQQRLRRDHADPSGLHSGSGQSQASIAAFLAPQMLATRLGDEDDPGYRLRRVQLPRSVRICCAAAQDMRSGSVMSGKSRTKTSTSTAVAAETSRGPSRLVKGFSTTPGINSSTSKFRKYMRGKNEPTSQGTAFAK